MRSEDKAILDLVPHEQPKEARTEIMNILLRDIRNIEAQLGSKERCDSTGRKLSPSEYHKWRTNAVKAMNHRVLRYREYKQLEKQDAAREAAPTYQFVEVKTGYESDNATNPTPESNH